MRNYASHLTECASLNYYCQFYVTLYTQNKADTTKKMATTQNKLHSFEQDVHHSNIYEFRVCLKENTPHTLAKLPVNNLSLHALRIKSSSFVTTTLCGLSPSQPSLSKLFYPWLFPSRFLLSAFFRSSITSSCHRCLGLPIGLVPIGLQSNSFLVGLTWSIRWICPSHLILCALTLRRLMSYIYGAPILDVSRSHTTTQHSR